MNAPSRRARLTAALTVVAALVAPAAADAAVTTTKWNRAQFLQHTLGFPANSNPAIDSVTYDRFQHLLRQTGNYALLIGDPATDAAFAERARTVEAAARTAGIAEVYWFNPNLSGGAKLGAATAPNLDIRNADGITTLTANSRAKYKDAWGNIVAQSLGNGIVATRTNPGDQTQAVTTAAGANVNDAGTPIYDYSAGTPANLTDSYFLVYNTDNKAGAANDKIVASVNLSKDTDIVAKVTAAVAGRTFATVDQFEWWKEEANERARVAATNATRGPNVPVVTDADNAAADGGWRVNQVTFPEFVDLLQNATDADAAILLGGTWCPNTRAVLPFVNEEAQKHDVTVWNYDTVLDGGKVAGSPTSGSNPLQTRNPHGNGAYPSFLYGELVKQYLSNFQTQYQVSENNAITFYPGGDTSKPAEKVARLQVPYLFAYKGKGGTEPFGGTTRHWISPQPGSNPPNIEYMSNWWLTNPQPNQIGLTGLPQAAPYWTTLNQRVANYTWKTDPATVLADRTISTDATQFILDGDTATVTPTSTGLSVASGGANPVAAGPAAIAPALAALGANAPTSFDDLKAKHLAERAKPAPDQTYLNQLNALAAPWGLADTRKSSVNTAWGNAKTPNSIIGGTAAKRALVVFFGGLPGGPLTTTRTLSAPEAVAGSASSVSVKIANPAGRQPSGTLSIDVKSAGASVFAGTASVAGDTASFAVTGLGAGTYEYTVSYPGDEFIDAFSETGSLTVKPAPVVQDPPIVQPIVTPVPTPTPQPPVATKTKASKVAGAVSKAPTSKKAGKYKVTITTAKSAAKATGKVTLTFKKGKTSRKVTGTLSSGTVTVTVPKLARGTWKVSIAWAGDTRYLAAKASGKSIKVTR